MSKGSENNVEQPVGLAAPDGPQALRHRPVLPPVESIDTFAIEDQTAEPESLQGSEPSVFGGINPQQAPVPTDAAAGASATEALADPATNLIDEPLSAADLLGEAPRIDFKRIIKSTPFLISCLVVLLIASTVFIRATIPTETFVQTELKFENYEKLDDEGKHELQFEINRLIRTYPLRAQAWELLQKRSPSLRPGFLNSGLTFHRLDALAWEPNGTLRVRIDSPEPADDIVRLAAIVETFYTQAQVRNLKRDESRQQLTQAQNQQFELLQLDAQLKKRIDDLLPGAQRYMDLKAALQATERYLELADESNPLRLVARQNLRRLTVQVADARAVAVERDEKLNKRIAVQKEVDDLTGGMARLRRYIDTFAYPQQPDSKNIRVFDTRPHQKAVLRYTLLSLITLFGGIIGYLHYVDFRSHSVEREARRERRRRVASEENHE